MLTEHTWLPGLGTGDSKVSNSLFSHGIHGATYELGIDQRLNSMHVFCDDACATEVAGTMGLCKGGTETRQGACKAEPKKRWTLGISGSPADANR